jgi:AcrR family transcriptional regulator
LGNNSISLRERKKQQTHVRILEAARDLFQLQGFDDTSIEEIVERAEVSRGTFFNYFPTKETLLSELADQELTSLEKRVEKELQNVPAAATKIRKTMRMLVRDTLPFMRVTRYVFLDALRHTASTGKGSTNIRLGDILQGLVIEAQSQGEIRCDLDPDEIAQAIVGAYVAAVFGQVTAMPPPSPNSLPMVESIVDMLFEGIAGPRYHSSDTTDKKEDLG